MSDHLTDIIRSFIGLWHMDDVTNKMPVELLGTPVSPKALDEIVILPSDPGVGVRSEFDELKPMMSVEKFDSSPDVKVEPNRGVHHDLPLQSHFSRDGFAKAPVSESSHPAPYSNSAIPSSHNFLSENYSTIYSTIYPTAADSSEDIHITQQNIMVDNDTVIFAGLEDVQIDFEVDHEEILAGAFQEIKDATSELIDNPLQIIDPQSSVKPVNYDPQADAGGGNPNSVATGNYFQLNGDNQSNNEEAQSSTSEINEDNFQEVVQDRLQDSFERPDLEIAPDLEADRDAASDSGTPQSDDENSQDTATQTGLDEDRVLSTSTGDNFAANFAGVTEVSDGHGSLIVAGDYHEVNTIAQVNILHDQDETILPEQPFTRAPQDDNISINNAMFETTVNPYQDMDFYGPVPLGMSWQVETIVGDYYDNTFLYQQNIMVDNDLVLQTTTQTNVVLTTGDNLQANAAGVYSYSDGFDLVIVSGHYYEYNTIVQVNVIYDNDVISVPSGAGDGANLDLQSSGNGLFNQASITNIGGQERFDPLNDQVNDLYDQAQSGEEEISGSLGELLPGNGGVEISVLFVDGNFYDQTQITQVNVVLDMDYVGQVSLDEEGSGLGGQDLEISTGNNTAHNIAAIVDVDSPSSSQYLGGDYYENSFLIQADILVDESITITVNANEMSDQTVVQIADEAGATETVVEPDFQDPPEQFDDDILGGIIA